MDARIASASEPLSSTRCAVSEIERDRAERRG